MSMDSVDIVHGLSRQFPWTQWTLSSQFLGVSRHTLYRAINAYSEGMSTESMDIVWSEWAPWTLSRISMDFVH